MKTALMLTGIYWNNTYQRHQQFANYLVRAGYKVIFVEHIISSRFCLKKMFKIINAKIHKKSNVKKYIKNIPEGITTINLHFVNPEDGIFRYINNKRIDLLIENIKEELGTQSVNIIINYLPISTTRYIISQIGYDKLIYDCVRDFTNWGEACKNMKYEENKLVSIADYVFTDSYYLTNKMKKSKKEVIQFLPVIDMDWASGCKKYNVPEKILRLGYFGTFDTHIDIDILRELINHGYEIHFWGKEELQPEKQCINHGFFSDLKELANDIINTVDAIIIPYKGNMDGVIPAKIMQALCTYLPVYISTFYDSDVLRQYLYVYRSFDELLELLMNYNSKDHINKEKKIKKFLSDKYENVQYKNFKVVISK